MATSPEPPNSDLLFSRYRIERELGRGGMGRVMLAYDTKLEIHVALKIVPDQLVPDTEAVNDLRQEVHRGMALMHPSIIRTHTLELDEGGAAIVMEYIDGVTLADLKEQQNGRCFDPPQVLPLLEPLCAVLDYAHRDARIVHRDLKPRNIMLTRDGRMKVADFGIAATLSDTVTRVTGRQTSGTPAYMSPQQARGKRPTHLDDVYSLGATIYDLLTSKPPFLRGNILLQVAEEIPPDMAARRAELEIHGKMPIPAIWEITVAQCLDKDPAKRPQSAGEVVARLRAHQAAAVAPTPPPIPTVTLQSPPALPPAVQPPPIATAASNPSVRSVQSIPIPTVNLTTTSPSVYTTVQPPVRPRSGRGWWIFGFLLVLLLMAVVTVVGLVFLIQNQQGAGSKGRGSINDSWADSTMPLQAADFAGTWRGQVDVSYTVQSSNGTFDGTGSMDSIITVAPDGTTAVREDGQMSWRWNRVPFGSLQNGTSPPVINGPYNAVVEGDSLVWSYAFQNGTWTKYVKSTLTFSKDRNSAIFFSTSTGTDPVTGGRETNVHRAVMTRNGNGTDNVPADAPWKMKK